MQDERLDPPGDVAAARRLSPWWGIHAARYEFARRRLGPGRVLDVACGSGYGLELLRTTERFVIGVDADTDSMPTVAARTDLGATSAVAALAGALPFAAASFDAVVSLETIEHLHDRGGFLAEIARVLKPGGSFVLSTPNAAYTEPVDGVPRNPFHVHEYMAEELRSELGRFFEVDELLGQVLSTKYRTSPFVDDQLRIPRRPGPQLRRAGWRVANKLPANLRDVVSRMLFGRAFYPTEHDYEFLAGSLEYAPVLVAIGTRPDP